jgi:hypothetical protein
VIAGRSGPLILAAGGALLIVVTADVFVEPLASPPSTLSSQASLRPPPRLSPESPSGRPRTPSTPEGGPPAPTSTPAAIARLRIAADVPGASVFLDRRYIGRAPVEVNALPGSHRLNVSVESQEMYVETLEVTPGPRDVMVRFKQVRLDGTRDVVHRHAIGSCHGRLVATPAGLRYETDHREDAFTRPFGDLEPLAVDYLKKNLRVKVRGGEDLQLHHEGRQRRRAVALPAEGGSGPPALVNHPRPFTISR